MASAGEEAERRERLARAKAVATGLLAACVVLLVAARLLEPRDPGWAYVAAFAQAAIVGGLADWYAVVVLFRHPFGLRMPHTAIIPSNHGRIADNLGGFIERHFLAPELIGARLASIDLMALGARWVAEPAQAGAVSGALLRFLPQALESSDTPALRAWLSRLALSRLEELDLSPVAAGLLESFTREGRHHFLLDEMLAALHRLLSQPDAGAAIQAHIRAELPSLFQILRAETYVFGKLLRITRRLVDEVGADPAHPLRQEFDALLASYVFRLREDAALRDKVEAIKRDLLARPEVRDFVEELWLRLKAWLVDQAGAPDSVLRGQAERLLREWAQRIGEDEALRAEANRWLLNVVQTLVGAYRHKAAQFISSQVRGWDASQLSRIVELNIGKDLQYIRINGTLVGGTLGLAIESLSRLLS